jgi:hypothetical protein
MFVLLLAIVTVLLDASVSLSPIVEVPVTVLLMLSYED